MAGDGRVMVHVRLPRDLVKQVDHAAVDSDLDRGRMVEALIRIGLKERPDAS